jgi:hypothetical protein
VVQNEAVYAQPQVSEWDYKNKKRETDNIRHHPSKIQSTELLHQSNFMCDISYEVCDVTHCHDSKKEKK